MANGKIVQIIGAVVDVEFPREGLPRVYDALKLMGEKNVGALLVLEQGKLVGIISERDYARKVILKGKSSLNTPVRDIMTDRVMFVRPEQTVEECMALMTEKHIRHLPVLVGDQVAGIGIGPRDSRVPAAQHDSLLQFEGERAVAVGGGRLVRPSRDADLVTALRRGEGVLEAGERVRPRRAVAGSCGRPVDGKDRAGGIGGGEDGEVGRDDRNEQGEPDHGDIPPFWMSVPRRRCSSAIPIRKLYRFLW